METQKNMRIHIFFITLILSLMLVDVNASTSIKHFTESDGLPQSLITCVTQDSKGYIWISSWNGLSRYDGYSFSNFKARQGDNCPLITNRIYFIRETKGGDILCKCPDGYYLFKTNEKKFVALKNKKTDKGDRFRPTPQQTAIISSLPEYKDIETRILYKDRQGGYWIYTHRGLDRLFFGKEKVGPTKFSHHGEEVIRSLFCDKENRIFIADKNGFVRICTTKGLPIGYLTKNGNISKTRMSFGASVYSMLQDSHGFLWIGTKPNGLLRLRESKDGSFSVKSFTQKANSNSISCNNVYAIKEDPSGRILVGTFNGGLNIIENPWSDSPKFINRNHGLQFPKEANSIYDMLLTPDSTLLLATNHGIFTAHIDKNVQKIRFLQNKRIPADPLSISNNQAMALLRSNDGTIYVATYGGSLNIIEKESLHTHHLKFSALTTENGMMSDVVLNMCEDAQGMIWLVSEYCLMKYNPKKRSFTNYSESLFTGHFSFSEAKPLYVSESHTIFFGTTQGALTINEKTIRKSNFVPKILFDVPSHIELSPQEKSLRISFAAIDLNKNEHIQYAYMLEGVDTHWMYTTENHINLSNIPAGTFRLKIKSTNGDGIWCDNETFVTIHRTPYFNERPIAWMLYGGLILIACVLSFRLYRYIRRLQNEIKTLKLSAGEKMEYIKVRVADMIDHNAKEPANTDSIESSTFRSKVEKIVLEHLSDTDLNVDFIAKEMCTSRSSLYIIMKKELDCTPNNFILDIRLNAARQMLLEKKSLNVSEVAYRCGFSDPKYFSRCFKKAMGVTPSEIRMD